MHRLSRIGGLLVTLIVLASAVPLTAQEDTGENPLLEMLGSVPDTEVYRDFVTYGNFALWYESWGFERIRSVAELERLSDADDPRVPATLFTMTYQTSAPQALGLQYLLTDDLRRYAGFDLFNVDRFLEAGSPPDTITLLDYSFDDEQIEDALTASGYEASEANGATLFSIRDDYEADLTSPVRSAMVGTLNRIAVLDGTAIVARATALVESALAARAGDVTSLADNPAYAAAVEALYSPALDEMGDLVGAIFVYGPPWDVISILGPNATREQVERMMAELESLPSLPPYELTAFATLHAEDGTHLVLAVVFPEGVDAEAAAESIVTRMEQYTTLRTRQPLMDLFDERGLSIEASMGIEANDRPVALVSVFAPDPTLELDDNGRLDTYVFRWIDMVVMRDLGFLAVSGGE